MIVYTTPLDWEPDWDIVNTQLSDMEYLAWELGYSNDGLSRMWAIAAVHPNPSTPLSELLPPSYKPVNQTQDLFYSGFTRNVFETDNYAQLEVAFNAQVDLTRKEYYRPIIVDFYQDGYDLILEWDTYSYDIELSAATGYEVRIKAADSPSWGSWIDVGNTLAYMFTDLDEGTLYWAQVRAYNASNDKTLESVIVEQSTYEDSSSS